MISINLFNPAWKTGQQDSHGQDVWAFDWTVRESFELEFKQLADFVTNNHIETPSKQESRLWTFQRLVKDPARNEKGEIKRNNRAAFSGATLLVLDFDGGLSIDEFVERHAGLSCILYSTYSHRSARKKGRDCFRVLVELKEDIPWDLLLPASTTSESLLPALAQLFPEGDLTSFEPQRGHYTPSHAPGAEWVVKVLEGEALDWRELELEEKLQPKPVPPRTYATTMGGTGKLLLWTMDLERYFSDKGLIKKHGAKLTVVCPNEAAHSTKDDATALFRTERGWQFKCHHAHCGGSTWVKRLLLEQEGQEALRPYCETRVDELELNLAQERTEAEELERIKVDAGVQRDFSLPYGVEERRRLVKDFTLQAIKNGGALVTPEGFGKSTQITLTALRMQRKLVFCTESHAQAEEKTQGFVKFGAVHVWSLGGLLKHRHGVDAILEHDAEEWEDNAVDIAATKEAVMDQLKLSWLEADALVEDLRDEVKDYDREAPVLVTSFHTASRLAQDGNLNRVIVVDDPSVKTLQSRFYALEENEWVLKHEKPIEKQLFGRTSSRNPIIWTTTEMLVIELLKARWPGLFVQQVEQNIKTEQHIFLYGTRLALSRTRPVLYGMQQVINKECKESVSFIANAANSTLNLVNTKGRNDLQQDSTICVSWPPDAAAVAVAGSLGLDVNDATVRQELKLQLMIDALNQAIGRCMGYRHKDGVHALVLCPPTLVGHITRRCRYELTRPDQVQKRTSKLKGLEVPITTLRFEHTIPEWLFRWPVHLFIWEKWVKEIPVKDRGVRILELITTFNQASDPSVDKKHIWGLLEKYATEGDMRWKEVIELLEGDGRRNFSEHLKELVKKEKKSYTGQHFKERNKERNRERNKERNKAIPRKPTLGRKKFVDPATGKKYYRHPGKEEAGWILVNP